MKIVVFLGNPGSKYAGTRHNIGFTIGEYFASTHSITASQKKFAALIGTGRIGRTEVCLVFPQTFMNSSGESVVQVMNYYKEKPENIIVAHDEIEFPFAKIAMKFGGGHKGHNGIRSIAQQVASPDFHRLRFGVGRPENPDISVADYVLGKFLPEEKKRIEELLPEVASMLEDEIGK